MAFLGNRGHRDHTGLFRKRQFVEIEASFLIMGTHRKGLPIPETPIAKMLGTMRGSVGVGRARARGVVVIMGSHDLEAWVLKPPSLRVSGLPGP